MADVAQMMLFVVWIRWILWNQFRHPEDWGRNFLRNEGKDFIPKDRP